MPGGWSRHSAVLRLTLAVPLQGNLRMTDAAMELVAQMSQLCRLEMQFFWQLTDDGAATPAQPSFMCLACR